VRFWYSAEVLRKCVSGIALKFDVLQSEEHCIGSFCCRRSYILSCSVLPYLTSISNALSLLQICEAKAIIMCRCKGELLPVDESKTRSPICYGVWRALQHAAALQATESFFGRWPCCTADRNGKRAFRQG